MTFINYIVLKLYALLILIFKEKTYSDKLTDFVSNKNGSLLLSLVKELLEYLELTFTTSVLDPETGAGHQYVYKNRDDIYEELSLSKGYIKLFYYLLFNIFDINYFFIDDKRPLLLQILEHFQSHSKSTNDVVKVCYCF